jgi:opacity protein-like surface antigen
MMKKLLCVLSLAVALMSSASAHAGNRTGHRFGLTLGLLGDPFPTAIGYNANFNLADLMRVVAGYGSISGTASNGTTAKLTTMGGGVRFFVPSWNFSPVVGVSWAKVSLTGTSLSGFASNTSHIYGTAGFDWQAANGFNLGFGANFSAKAGVGAVPYMNFGWFF